MLSFEQNRVNINAIIKKNRFSCQGPFQLSRLNGMQVDVTAL